jgi:hypothetical protein
MQSIMCEKQVWSRSVGEDEEPELVHSLLALLCKQLYSGSLVAETGAETEVKLES